MITENENKLSSTEINYLEDKSIIKIVGNIFMYDSIISLIHLCKNTFSLFKQNIVFGFYPNNNSNNNFIQEIKNSKSVLGVYILFTFFRLVFTTSLQTNTNLEQGEASDGINEQILDFFILVIYAFSILIFSYTGKFVSYFSLKNYKNRLIETFFIREFNFLFLIYFTLMLLGFTSVDGSENKEDINRFLDNLLYYSIFIWIHSMYTFYISFIRLDSFSKFKRMLVLIPIFLTIVSFFIFTCFSFIDSIKFTN
jgi:hypothetical protein